MAQDELSTTSAAQILAADDPVRDALAIDGLSVRYGRAITALSSVSLRVGRGEVVALMGLNGAGKTTLARAITGLLQKNSGRIVAGSVRSFERRITGLAPRSLIKLGISQTMESRRLFPDLTVGENLAIGGYTRRRDAARRQQRESVLELFPRLAERESQLAGYLSGGEQQMLAIGRALMQSPRLLIMDEPTLGLSPKLVALIGSTIASVSAEGISVLLIEQNASMALSVAHRAYVIARGQIVREGPASALANDANLQRMMLGLQSSTSSAGAAG